MIVAQCMIHMRKVFDTDSIMYAYMFIGIFDKLSHTLKIWVKEYFLKILHILDIVFCICVSCYKQTGRDIKCFTVLFQLHAKQRLFKHPVDSHKEVIINGLCCVFNGRHRKVLHVL